MIDTHCHLYTSEFDEDREEMISRALNAGVTQMMLPNIDLESIRPMHDLVDAFPNACYPMMGLHPCSVREDYTRVLNQMEALLNDYDYVGIGETGTDLFWDATYFEQQKDSFRIQIRWAKEKGIPVIIHSRETLDLNIDIITDEQDGNLKGIFHCFNGNIEQAMRIRDLGFKIGIGGIVTFKNGGLDKVLPEISRDMLVLETDAPYLAPVPFRGKRNESSYLNLITEKLAEILQTSVGEVASLTSGNARSVFEKKA